jgi:hypothetical protein
MMNIDDNKMLVEWNKLLERLQAGDVGNDDVALFAAGATVMSQALYQMTVAADVEWRQKLLQFHERQTELMRRQAVALERLAKAMEFE